MFKEIISFFEIVGWGNIFLFSFLFLVTLLVTGIFSFLVRVLWHLFLDLEKKIKKYIVIATFFVVTVTLYFFIVINKFLWFTPEEDKKIDWMWGSYQFPPYSRLLLFIIFCLMVLVVFVEKMQRDRLARITFDHDSIEVRIMVGMGGRKDPKKEKAIWTKAQKQIKRQIKKYK